jgi:hypothetical protein
MDTKRRAVKPRPYILQASEPNLIFAALREMGIAGYWWPPSGFDVDCTEEELTILKLKIPNLSVEKFYMKKESV